MTTSSTACSGAKIGPPEDYAYAYAGSGSARPPRVSYAGVQELCKQPGSGVTAWPFADIERKVGLNDEQKALLGDVRRAAADAAATFKASCPSENAFPLTPPGRLTAMTARLEATLDAVKIVRPALEKFYNSLSDEQKERFNELGPKRPVNNPETTAALPQDGKSCSETETRPDQVADREDRGRGQADRRAAGRAQAVGGRHRQGGLDPAGGLPGGRSAHAARPAGGDGETAASDDRSGARP